MVSFPDISPQAVVSALYRNSKSSAFGRTPHNLPEKNDLLFPKSVSVSERFLETNSIVWFKVNWVLRVCSMCLFICH